MRSYKYTFELIHLGIIHDMLTRFMAFVTFLNTFHILFSLAFISHRIFFFLQKYISADNMNRVVKKVFTM